jgi:hypothetical protein
MGRWVPASFKRESGLKLRFDSRKQELLAHRYVAEQELRIIDAWVGRSEEL